MSKVWRISPKSSEDLITQILNNRGLTKKEEIEKFFNPKLEDFEKDINIPGIPKALERIKKAIEKEEQIIVYGDYDVDGVCASAIVYKALASLGAKVLPYIPHREKEGYGLSKQGLEYCRDTGATLVITVDHGIVAFEMCEYAKELGLDLIITDHHQPREKNPECEIIVHSTTICGAGVAWCLVRKIIKEELIKELLELVALATVCDMMPLLGINRYFVKEGLKQLNRTKNIGLRELLMDSGVEMGKIDSYTLGHILGPRLNAIGRLEHAIDALRLLCTRDQVKARKLSSLLNQTNLKRQELTQLAFEKAKLQFLGDGLIQVVHSKEWVPGVIGLVAAKMAEEFNRPSIAISVGEIYSKGSARSVNGLNIVELIRGCSDILVDVGGHKGAAGFTIETAKLEEFKTRIGELTKDLEKSEESYLEIEAQVLIRELSKKLAGELEKFEPFGFGNPVPVLASRGVEVRDPRTVGSGKHLKFKADGVEAIAFGKGDLSSVLKSDQLVDLAYCLEINRFNGSEILQLKVKDILLD